MSKKPIKAERDYMSKVASMGCIVCTNNGYHDSPAEIHHLLTGKGMSQRASNYDVIPLCAEHHRNGGYGFAVHAGVREFEKNHGTEKELLEQIKSTLEARYL